MSRRLAFALICVLGAIVIAIAVLQPWRSDPELETESSGPVTEVVERTTLTSNLVLNGNLSYGESIDLPGRSGTITALPKAGQIVSVGQALYEVDGKPVVAVRGDRPFWRPLSYDSPDGPDIQQLEQFLVSAGFGTELDVDTVFTRGTERAVEAWQEASGFEVTGTVGLGDVVAVGSDSIRIDSVIAELGDQAVAGSFAYTSTSLRVIAKLTDAQAREILPATVVTVTLPDGTDLAGEITAIDPGGEPTGKDEETTSPTAVVELDDPGAAEGIGLRAVKVSLAAAAVADALVVPVTALVATIDGGYAVDVVREEETVRVPVELGLIADARVQVIGGDLVEGDLVVVAQ
ncbi:peptidoglycan-binding domain-containing protein [Leifsonia sp. H3M29-4]|uniref:peptidoglycan-binding protein n=1 Tax=Salinibacterium metalliresistens TaxID=3031321 RepID=UPI0023DAD5F5|nr:peptidoglycan-binding domain-containing protein [Salinibacterium metalliresistens]MDF1477840.1 peptidoglycan-binding domain-containing protein [Salinibacterium metalliresistens]